MKGISHNIMFGQGRLTPTTLAILEECGLNDILASLPAVINPKPLFVLEAFAQTPLEKTEFVLIGQDPYLEGATGLSFSKSRGAEFSPSIKNMFACLERCGFKLPVANHKQGGHYDLTHWAKQGVLCVNASLTVGTKANDHAKIWLNFTKKLVGKLVVGVVYDGRRLPPPCFILLGGSAQNLETEGMICHKWGHPSSLNRANNDRANPESFYNCDIFSKISIDWGLFPASTMKERRYDHPDYPEVLDTDIIWVFTDGAAKANGKANCRASWAYHVTDGVTYHEDSGECAPCDLGAIYKTSNVRGELTAILKSIDWCLFEAQNAILPFTHGITIVTDSLYSINVIEGIFAASANLDLIDYINDKLRLLRALHLVSFLHQKGHIPKKNKPAVGTRERFLVDHNDWVDMLATKVLS